jgi:hypothetical protein
VNGQTAVREQGATTPGVLVLLAGIATTIVTLVLVHFVNMTGFYPMGFLLWYVVPIGAILVGALCGSGYCAAQRFFNVRVSWGVIALIGGVSLLAYFTAHYLTYLSICAQLSPEEAEGVSFIDYLRFLCESVTIEGEGSEEPTAVGKLGYAVIALELIGFCLGATIPSLMLRGKPYCSRCGKYLRKHASYLLISRGPDEARKLKRKERKELFDRLMEEEVVNARKIAESIGGRSRDDVIASLEKARVPEQKKAMVTVKLVLSACPDCDRYHADLTMFTKPPGGEASTTSVGSVDGPESAEEGAPDDDPPFALDT